MRSHISFVAAAVLAFVTISALRHADWFPDLVCCQDEVCKRSYVQVTLGQGFSSIDSSGFQEIIDFPPIFFSGPDSDEGASIGFGAGRVYDYGEHFRLRTDVEVLFRENRDFRSNTGAPLLGTVFDVKVDNNWSVLGNIWGDYKLTERVFLYGGGGLGAAGSRISATSAAGSGRDHETDFAFQVGGGVIVPFNESWEIDLGYRYLDTGKLTVGLYAGGVRVGRYDIDQTSSELMLTVRYILP